MRAQTSFKIIACIAAIAGWTVTCSAVDYHVATAQALQNALTFAAASSVSNNIYVTNGYYLGNFNYNSTNVNELTLLAEPGVSNTQVTIDAGGTGSSMSMTATASPNLTVQGITFLRNTGNTGLGGLQITGGNTSIFVNNCLFPFPSTNASGVGLNILSGLNATVSNCTAVGTATPANNCGGGGIYISSVTNNVTVQNCAILTNSGAGLLEALSGWIDVGGSGIETFGASATLISGCLFIGNSSGNSGGGAFCNGTTITLSGNTFIGNSSGNGGGEAYCDGTTITLIGNTFTGNTLPGGGYQGGGGASCNGSTNILCGNVFTGNSALYGGGAFCAGCAYCPPGVATIFSNVFTGNSVVAGLTGNDGGQDGRGGGVYCAGSIILSNNVFMANSATGYGPYVGAAGGAAYCDSLVTNPMVIFGNTFEQNGASSEGGNNNYSVIGGALCATGPLIEIQDNLAADNTVSSGNSQGGGIWVDAIGTLNMINNTVTGNTSADSGGGVAYIVTGTVELLNVYNNIIWGNSATVNGGDVYLSGTGKTKLLNYNDVDSIYGVWDLAQNNIDLAPQFFDPINGDYHTQSTSPCIADGTTNAPALPATDLDGGPRVLNGKADLGCYEFTTNVAHPADLASSFVITPAEFCAYAAAWKNGLAWTNAPNPIPANYMTRAGYLMTNGGAYYSDGSARPLNWKLNP